jgi:hypothetical protein
MTWRAAGDEYVSMATTRGVGVKLEAQTHSLTESRNASRLPAATLATSWMSSMVASGTRKEGTAKKMGSDRHLVILSPEWNNHMFKREWCILFKLRHTHQLTSHWRNSSALADESECGCGVIDTSPVAYGIGMT